MKKHYEALLAATVAMGIVFAIVAYFTDTAMKGRTPSGAASTSTGKAIASADQNSELFTRPNSDAPKAQQSLLGRIGIALSGS